MPPSVKNIEITECAFGDIAAQLKKAYPYIQLDAAAQRQIKELTPNHTRKIQFDLTANTALANGWRRVMLDEVEWPRLNCGMDNIITDDPFCRRLTDYIQNRVQLIPTSYLTNDKVYVGQLDVKNDTQQNIIVQSSAIQMQIKNKDKSDKVDRFWNEMIDLCILMPGRSIKISFTVEWGINRSHASYSSFNSMLFQPLDAGKPIDMREEKLAPSYSVHPGAYRLGFACESMIDPRHSARLGWKTIIEKLERAAKAISDFQDKQTLPYLTDYLHITQIKGGVMRYEFKGETRSITNILAWYSYVLDRSITFINAGDDHPEDPSSLVRIVHKDHAKLLREAATSALKDCEIIIKAF